MTTTRVSRWSSTTALPVIDTRGNILPAAITNPSMTPEQLEAYVAHFRVREITQQLQQPDGFFETNHHQQQSRKRSRSPDPEYDARGHRTNTRVKRHRRALEAERDAQLKSLATLIPQYQPPHGVRHRCPTHLTERVPIPHAEHPDLKIVGQLLGPRGRSLQSMESRSGARIAIRGKDSNKEGQQQRRGRHDNDEVPLHALITADTQSKVDAARGMVEKVIHDAIHKEYADNAMKQQQMRDLATLNGTLRDDEGRRGLVIMTRGIEASKGAATDENTTISAEVKDAGFVDSSFDADYELLMEDLGLASADRKQVAFKTIPPWRR